MTNTITLHHGTFEEDWKPHVGCSLTPDAEEAVKFIGEVGETGWLVTMTAEVDRFTVNDHTGEDVDVEVVDEACEWGDMAAALTAFGRGGSTGGDWLVRDFHTELTWGDASGQAWHPFTQEAIDSITVTGRQRITVTEEMFD